MNNLSQQFTKLKTLIKRTKIFKYANHQKIIILRKAPLIDYLPGLKKYKYVTANRKKLIAAFDAYDPINDPLRLDKISLENFKKNFLKFLWAEPEKVSIGFTFLEKKIFPLKVAHKWQEIPKNEPIVICPVKNDLARMIMFLDHHRNLGIKYFAIIDNMSTDGTRKFLESQSDVDLYSCEMPYSTLNREAWINRIIAYYGINRWYLCLDSDELFMYQNMEHINILNFINNLEKNKVQRVRSLMIDMYSDDKIFKVDSSSDIDIKSQYCYFDTNSYTSFKTLKFEGIYGGPRNRVFNNKDSDQKVATMKHPLFYFSENEIQGNSHFQFPYKKNYNLPCSTAILHYKFLPGDLEKYRERIISKSYYNGSHEYSNYMSVYDANENLTFLYEGSAKITDSSSLKAIKINNEPFFLNFL